VIFPYKRSKDFFLLLIASAIIVIQGCAFGGQTYVDVAKNLPEIANSSGRIFFYRDRKSQGSIIQPKLYVDGQSIGSSVPGGFFYLDKPDGIYEIKCSSSKISLRVEAGKTYYIEMLTYATSAGSIYDIRLIQITKTQAMPIIESLTFVGSQ
jgi:hypothetical protein